MLSVLKVRQSYLKSNIRWPQQIQEREQNKSAVPYKSTSVSKKNDFTRFAKSKINTTKDGKVRVMTLKGQESFRIQSFVKSNIWTIFPSGKSTFKKNEIVDCFLPNQPNKIFQ